MSQYCKFYKQKKQVSYDSGATWQDVVPYEYQKGDLYDPYSVDCGSSTIERWVNNGTICSGTSGYDKYYLQIKQISYDGGSTWATTSVYQLGELIEANSPDCGYTPPTPSGGTKWIAVSNSDSRTVERSCEDVAMSPASAITTCCDGPGSGIGDAYYSYYIGDCVVVIEREAFYLTKVTHCTVGKNVKSIGYGAFVYSNLNSIILPDGLIEIGSRAFAGCPITSIEIPDSVTTIYDSAFLSSDVSSIKLSSNLTDIGFRLLSRCPISTIEIPDSVTDIGGYAFSECGALTSVTFGNASQLTSIGDAAFYKTSIHSIDLPSGLTTIYGSAFSNCSRLTSIEIPNSVETIGHRAFKECTGLTSCTIGSGVTSIGVETFFWCTNLTSVTFGNASQLTSIGDAAFRFCTGLTSIDIPDSVTSIGWSAFDSCNSLTSVTIGSGVTSIGGSAFKDCHSLTSITITAINPPYLEPYMPNNYKVFEGTRNCPIYVPASSLEAYKTTVGWSTYSDRIFPIP